MVVTDGNQTVNHQRRLTTVSFNSSKFTEDEEHCTFEPHKVQPFTQVWGPLRVWNYFLINQSGLPCKTRRAEDDGSEHVKPVKTGVRAI